MPRLTPIDPAQAEGKTKALLDGVRKHLGMVPNLMATLAHSPAALEAYLGLGQALGRGALDARTRESIALAVASENGCDYCAAAHTALGKGLGVTAAELAANLQGSDCQGRANGAAAPLGDLAFMLACYDVYSAPPPGGCPEPLGEAPRMSGRAGDEK